MNKITKEDIKPGTLMEYNNGFDKRLYLILDSTKDSTKDSLYGQVSFFVLSANRGGRQLFIDRAYKRHFESYCRIGP